MGEAGVAVLLWMLALGVSGCALGCLVVFTMSAPFVSRLFAAGLVFAACFLAVGIVVVGLLPALFALPGIFLLPVLAAFGLRRRVSGDTGKQRSGRDRAR